MMIFPTSRFLVNSVSALLLLLASSSSVVRSEIIELTSEEFFTMKEDGAFQAIIDVRTRAEWDETGHVANATLLDSLQNANTADEIATIADLAGCEECPIVVYCRSGQRANVALEKLELAGFQGPLYNGLGVNQWTEAGYELVTTESVDPPCKGSDPEALPSCSKAVDPSDESNTGVGIAADGTNNVTETAAAPEGTDAASTAASLSGGWLYSAVMIVVASAAFQY